MGSPQKDIPVLFCREEATRTPDPHVPNVVRYQLRYFSPRYFFFVKRFLAAAGSLDAIISRHFTSVNACTSTDFGKR